jgi:hypothetical protein
MAVTNVEITPRPGASFKTEKILEHHGPLWYYDRDQELRPDVEGWVGQPCLIVRSVKTSFSWWLPSEEIDIEFI